MDELIRASEVAARAEALIEVGRSREAIALLQGALRERPHDPVLLDLLARAQLQVDPHAAAATAAHMIRVDPTAYRGYLLGSYAAAHIGNREQAILLAESAIRAAPEIAFGHAQLAQALAGKRGRVYRRARASARRALALAPHSAVSHITAGNVELGAGHRRRAAKHYRMTLEMNPQERVAETNLALVSGIRGHTAKALGALQRVLSLDPSDAEARRLLDRIIYAVIIDLQWIVLAVALLLFAVRNP